ncbi:MAG: helix-hairpin-helix domain-containing protein [Flavobacteriales bacterium]
MNTKFLKIALGTALMSCALYNCGNTSEENQAVTEENDQSKKEEEKFEIIESTEVYNANLITEGNLTLVRLTDEWIPKILENRPFLSMTDLDTLLESVENKEEVYKKLFVPMNLNTTAEEDFKMIPGVGEKMAHEFEEYRPYKNMKQFRKEISKYVDAEEIDRYENYVFVPVELNSASEEEILALPGLGKKMAHEFEEYRPYKNMTQFRKEIGKYVDDKELKRLERLVFIAK